MANYIVYDKTENVLGTIEADRKILAERMAYKAYGRSVVAYVKACEEIAGKSEFEAMMAYINRDRKIYRNGDIVASITLGSELADSDEMKKPEFTQEQKELAFAYAKFVGQTCYEKVRKEF